MCNYKCNLLLACENSTPVIRNESEVILYEGDEFNLICEFNTTNKNTNLTWKCGTFDDFNQTREKDDKGNFTIITNLMNGTANRKLNNQTCNCTEDNENNSASVTVTVYCKYEGLSFICFVIIQVELT